MNIFMEQVKNATLFSFRNMPEYFKYRRKLKKFIKTIKNGSPSLGVLWYFADFIQYAEIIYSFDNNKNGILYSSRVYNPGQNGFRINSENVIITIKLYSADQKVGIDIQNKNSGNITTNYTFINQEWEKEPDEYDVLLIERAIKIINQYMIELTLWCIERKLDEFSDVQLLLQK